MKTFNVRNVNGALSVGLNYLMLHGTREQSRNGPVLSSQGPVTTVYAAPWERVLFAPERDANPFFHYAESMWMLAGRNDAAFPGHFAGQIKEYAETDGTLRGAYGQRWRSWWGFDQLELIIKQLRADPTTRRCVLSMWDAGHDLFSGGQKDIPCNTHCYFRALDGELQMLVSCRSNDAVWGAHGANSVHFSFLHEYVARSAGLTQGAMTQMSFNYHVYPERPDVARLLQHGITLPPHNYHSCAAYDLFNDKTTFDAELLTYFDHYDNSTDEQFEVAYTEPAVANLALMEAAYRAHKVERTEEAMTITDRITFEDWRLGCGMWLERRIK